MDYAPQFARLVLAPARPSFDPSVPGAWGDRVLVQSPGLRAAEQQYIDDAGADELAADGTAVVAWSSAATMSVGLRELRVSVDVVGLAVELTLNSFDPVTMTWDDPYQFDFVDVTWDWSDGLTNEQVPFSTSISHTYPVAGTYKIKVIPVYKTVTDVICNPDHPMKYLEVTVV